MKEKVMKTERDGPDTELKTMENIKKPEESKETVMLNLNCLDVT
jgi:hypothetical protein